MNQRTRRKRAILRDRRRGWHGITPLIGPLNGHDLFLIRRYYDGFVLPSEQELGRRIFGDAFAVAEEQRTILQQWAAGGCG